MQQCRKCGSEDLTKNGSFKGRQRFFCKSCGSYFVGNLQKQGRKKLYEGKGKNVNVRLFPEHFAILNTFLDKNISGRIRTCIENAKKED